MNGALLLLSVLGGAAGSLPPAVGDSRYSPGELAPAFTVPLLRLPYANTTASLKVNPAQPLDGQPLPLVVMAFNSTDPWSAVMVGTNQGSVDDFLMSASTRVHYLFAGRTSVDEAARIAARLFKRIEVLGLDPERKRAWQTHLHFANGTVDDLGGTLADVLASWTSAVTTIALPSSGLGSLRRLDGHYGWCAWPDEVQAVTVVDGGSGCVAKGGLAPCNGSLCDFVLLSLNGSCTPEHAASVAQAAGFGGVVVAQAPGEALVEIGASGAVDSMPLVVTMIGSDDGELLASLAAASPSGVATSFNYTVVPGFFLSVDATGALRQVGWEKLPTLRMLGWAGEYLEYLADLAQRQAQPALVVPLLDHAVLKPSAQVNATLPSLSSLRAAGLNKLEVQFHLDCEGQRDEDCSVWDHCVTLTATCSGQLQQEHQLPPGEVGGAANEIWRGITAFRRRSGKWLTEISEFAPLLFPTATDSPAQCQFEMQVGGETWVASDLALRFTAEVGHMPLPFAATHCDWPNPSTSFKSASYNANRTIFVEVPNGAAQVRIAAIITGHSGCEFVPSSHHFVVNGVDFNTSTIAFDRFMKAGSDFGCTDFVTSGSVPNEHGTWYYGRNGWCDGADVPPLVWDVTEAALADGLSSFNLTYYALAYDVGGTNPTQDGCDGGILMTANVAFYD